MALLGQETAPFRQYINRLGYKKLLLDTTATVTSGGMVFDIDWKKTIYYYDEIISIQAPDGMVNIDATDSTWSDSENARTFHFKNGEQVIFKTGTANSGAPTKRRGRPKKIDKDTA